MDLNDQSRFLEGLTAEQALRYKAAMGPLSAELILDMVSPMLPPMLNTETTERLAASLSAAAKCFVIDIMEEARQYQDQLSSSHNLPSDHVSVEPAHLLESYRRMALEGRVLGAQLPLGTRSRRAETSRQATGSAAEAGGGATAVETAESTGQDEATGAGAAAQVEAESGGGGGVQTDADGAAATDAAAQPQASQPEEAGGIAAMEEG